MIRDIGYLSAFCLSVLLGTSCASEQEAESESAGLVRTGEVVVNNSIDQPESIGKGLYGLSGDSLVYGIDFRRSLPYQLNLANGNFRHLAESGRGPQELELPSQVTVKNSGELYVYDTSLDLISHFKDGRITGKMSGYLEQGIWLRHPRDSLTKGEPSSLHYFFTFAFCLLHFSTSPLLYFSTSSLLYFFTSPLLSIDRPIRFSSSSMVSAAFSCCGESF